MLLTSLDGRKSPLTRIGTETTRMFLRPAWTIDSTV